ncbi:sodium/glutamate symporter [Leisingera caerulea]|uniref:sodium/glutamate symporter n=1 Tax=Leisingera caerulea TaxID=506591 RepID=UPI000683F683|nr:sodium/glutamate symporter [Leisingera caerulea]
MSHVLQGFALLGLFLLIGTFLRAKIGWLQKLFIPASVVGGAVGLLIGPQIWGDLTPVQYPADWIKMYSLLPGILIIPVVASVPLGIQLSRKGSSAGTARNVFNMFFLMAGLFGLQLAVGGAVGAFFATSMPDLGIYATFGLEMPLGFSGGHGTAGVIGNMLNGMGLEYWEVAQGVAVTFATIGLLGGIIAGIVIINWLNKRKLLDGAADPQNLPKSWLTGLEPNPEKQRVAGRESTVSTSIDVLGFNLALILAGSGLAILLRSFVRSLDLPLIGVVPVWAYAIIVMWLVWLAMTRLGVAWLVDPGTKSKIASSLTDFAIVAALVSMPVQGVLTFAAPILIAAGIGFIGTVAMSVLLPRKLFNSAPFERAMLVFGTASGVFLTGLLLLKICDPDLKSPAMRDGSLAYSMNTVLGFVLIPFIVGAGVQSGPIAIAGVGAVVLVGAIVGMFIVSRMRGSASAAGQKEGV